MSPATQSTSIADRELVLTRVFDAPPEKVFHAWTDPELLKQWFVPQPWTLSRAEIDLRPGGTFLSVMRNPEGEEFVNPGVFLEVIENELLVFTDAYTTDWEPSEEPFMTAIISFEDQGSKTLYTARAVHWSIADRVRHEQMGFYEGWGQAADQLAELLKRI